MRFKQWLAYLTIFLLNVFYVYHVFQAKRLPGADVTDGADVSDEDEAIEMEDVANEQVRLWIHHMVTI